MQINPLIFGFTIINTMPLFSELKDPVYFTTNRAACHARLMNAAGMVSEKRRLVFLPLLCYNKNQ
ncbi:MAG TPA: hypothetical protein DEF06_01195 [Clostridiales bacterium]|nr:hypothetical protein [Clostridiales bacterium]